MNIVWAYKGVEAGGKFYAGDSGRSRRAAAAQPPFLQYGHPPIPAYLLTIYCAKALATHQLFKAAAVEARSGPLNCG